MKVSTKVKGMSALVFLLGALTYLLGNSEIKANIIFFGLILLILILCGFLIAVGLKGIKKIFY